MPPAPSRIPRSLTRISTGICSRSSFSRATVKHARLFATETTLPEQQLFQPLHPPPASGYSTSLITEHAVPAHIAPPTVLATLYSFPSFEPTRFIAYPSSHLLLPLRRDILHRAVIYEGDMTRQGTASTKYRTEVHGSNRKIRPQKGSGRARLGDKKSPMLRGGGRAFGPKPRDFSTELPRKVYDLAWRTALSYRYRRGQLLIVEGKVEIEQADASLLREIFQWNRWGKHEGKSLLVTFERREKLFEAITEAGEQGKAVDKEDVDVKDLLKMGRVIIERRALEWILAEHQSDLAKDKKTVTRRKKVEKNPLAVRRR